jgi:hypothetical protein
LELQLLPKKVSEVQPARDDRSNNPDKTKRGACSVEHSNFSGAPTFCLGITATAQKFVSSTTSSRRKDKNMSEESVDKERPGAISVKGRFCDVTMQDDILKESPDTVMDEKSLHIVAELVEDDEDRVSEMVAELMRQEKLRQMLSLSAQAYDGDPISLKNGYTAV